MSADAPAAAAAEPLPRGLRVVALVAIVALIAVGVALASTDPLPLGIAAGVVAAGAAALTVRARHAVPMLGYAAVATAGVAVLGTGLSGNVGWFAVCLLCAWCMFVGGRRAGVAYWAGAMALFIGEWLWATRDPGWGPWMAGTTLAALLVLLVRHEMELVAQLRAAQAGLAERARAEERNRIARDLHDVIAHTLVVSQLHVTGARLAVEHDPADAARALAEAERLGQETLAEVRRVVGLLRRDGESGGGTAAPLPAAGDLPALVQRFRTAGAAVTFTVEGDLAAVPATTGLAAYRIMQEALTNAAKHSAGSPVSIGVTVRPEGMRLTVRSAGPPGHGSGLGLLGMRERAGSVGGSCEAGPDGSGWSVCADLPLNDPVPHPVTT